MYRLDNPTRHYAWGSTSLLPEFLGTSPDGRPHAELWLGTHRRAPSRVRTNDGGTRPLGDVVDDRSLSYLLKVLAAERPLSLQVHPHRAMARAGFDDEESRGVALGARERSFTDPNHKPEMAVALTTFESLIGFRPTAELWDILPGVGAALTTRLGRQLRSEPGYAGIVGLLGVLLSERDPVPGDAVREVVDACAARVGEGTDPGRAYSTVVELAQWHPYDPGVVASLLLNRVTLAPGEAAFLAHGIIHAHLRGVCLEVQACSDNVLRAGLTDKHVDRDAVLRCLAEGMSDTFRIEPKRVGDTRLYVPPVEEFALAVTRRDDGGVESASGAGGGDVVPGSGPRIAICVDGTVEVSAGGRSMSLVRGQSVFVPGAAGPLAMTGAGALAQAYTP